ncbi:hypothetical protein [Brevibacterium litoralis]|uniref:hypothetical protein n=1 Tax=Brevibacterium litoralis TaxID=3138935 RepID=UPI0032EC44FA
MRATDEDVDQYISENAHAEGFRELDVLVRGSLPPDAPRVLWRGTLWGGTEQSIIGYGQVVQPRSDGSEVEWFLVGLARQKRGFSLYVNAVVDGAYIGQHYAERLQVPGAAKVRIGAASIGFSRPGAIDQDVLREMLAHAGRIAAGSPDGIDTDGASTEPVPKSESTATEAPVPSEIEDLLSRVKPKKRVRDARTLIDLYRRVTGLEPALHGTIIGFGTYHYRYESGREGEAPAAAFAPRANASTLYLTDGVIAHTDLLDRLGPHEGKVGCVYIKDLTQVDLAVLEEIVTESFRALTGQDTWTTRARDGA